MKCPICQLEMRIFRSRNVLENDNTPDAETKLFIEQELKCMNKNCQNFDKVVHVSKSELPIG